MLALYFTSPMKMSTIKRCKNCNWTKIPTLVVASEAGGQDRPHTMLQKLETTTIAGN